MAHPVVWLRKAWFYPMGTTPPVCLTQELSPEENAEVLLLGCGDPRSILFTIHHDLAPDYRPLDVTCCDWEPAVLARNILLLTMAADGVSTSSAWSIFYHLSLNQSEYDTLLAQCRALVQSSLDWETWKASKYGGYIRFCTKWSFSEVRRYWIKYLEFDKISSNEKRAIRATFESRMESVVNQYKDRMILTSLRSAGPLFMSFVDEAAKSHSAYWSTGTTQLATTLPHSNPTFLYTLSGKEFTVHYGIEPLPGFHLAPALVPIKGVHVSSNPNLQDAVKVAMDQFELWCSSFKKRVSVGSAAGLNLRFNVGEALAFCRALRVCQRSKVTQTGTYASQWGGTQVVLNENDYSGSPSSAPLAFNVIDTSNLTDHLGLLNILTVTTPLLQKKPWAVLHTDTVMAPDADGSPTSNLSIHALGDIPTLSLALGIAPSPCLSHFTTESNKHELLASSLSLMSSQLHGKTSWRTPTPTISGSVNDSLALDLQRPIIQEWQAKDLARYLFAVYLKMFDDENLASSLRNMTPTSIKNRSLGHYTRESLVALMALVKERIKSDWIAVVEAFDDLQAADRTLILDNNYYQEFICQLYLHDIYIMDPLKPEFLERLRGRNNLFRGWRDIPPVVCVVLKVPRDRFKVLEEMNSDEPLRPIFGDLSLSSVAGEPSITINEDLRGWDGNSDLIVSFFVPSWTLLQTSLDLVEIGLGFKSTPTSVATLMPKLGRHLNIFSTKLSNSANVQIVRHRPNNLDEIRHLRVSPALSIAKVGHTVKINFSAQAPKVSTLTIRDVITDSATKTNLSQGATVHTEPVADSVLRFYIEDYAQTLVYPFPVSVDQKKVRIARQSSYVEIEVPIRSNFENSGNLSLNMFPIACDGKAINLLNIHYVNLDKLPALELPTGKKDTGWLTGHLGLTIPENEKQAAKLQSQSQCGMLYNLKETVASIFNQHVNKEDRPRVFALSNPEDSTGVYTFIFLNEIRFDLSAQAVVADACVVPFFMEMMAKVLPALKDVSPMQIKTLNDETAAWKKLLPAFAERCRKWKHTDGCEYLENGIPAITEYDRYTASPLCSCGRGKDLGSFTRVESWKAFAPYATRVAIGLLFPFSNGDLTQTVERAASRPGSGGHITTSTPSSSSLTYCASCGKPGAPQRCGNCKTVRYCSPSCQKNHWKVHRSRCVRK